MDVMPAILARRSIRKYTTADVDDAAVHDLLAAAMAAPSANNSQPWHFLVITERARLAALADALPYGQMLRQAPLGIVVCAEEERSPGYWVQDCSAAAENILLAAHAQGLGGVWLGVYPREERVASVRSVADLPSGITPLCVLSIGHPAELKSPAQRFDQSRIHANRW